MNPLCFGRGARRDVRFGRVVRALRAQSVPEVFLGLTLELLLVLELFLERKLGAGIFARELTGRPLRNHHFVQPLGHEKHQDGKEEQVNRKQAHSRCGAYEAE